MKRITLAFVLMASTAEAFDTSGFEHPESILPDAAKERLYVSNIVGHPAEADGNGYISLVGTDGSIIEQKWATGMDAPKGMALFGDSLIVTDLTQIHVVDRNSGDITASFAPQGAAFLNDVTAANGRAFISDMFTGVIYSFDGSDIAPFYSSADLPHPNGLWTDGVSLVIGHWGPGMKEDFTTEALGDLLSIDIATKTATTLVPALGNLDGVAKTTDGFIVNDWISGKIFKVVGDTATEILQAPQSTADIAVYGDTLYLPHMFENRISSVDLKTLATN